jgi:hypothetical protein
MAKKPAAKRPAGKAGMDDAADKKPAKKRNPPVKQMLNQPSGQSAGATMGPPLMAPVFSHGTGEQHLQSNFNRPPNQMGYVAPSGAAASAGSLSASGAHGMTGAGHQHQQQQQHQQQHQPATVAQEIDGMTERMNSAQDGIEPSGDGTAVTAPLGLPQDFMRNETELASEKLRLGLSAAVGINLPGPSGPAQGLSRIQTGPGFHAGGSGSGSGPPTHESGDVWQYQNIVDKTMMTRAAVHVLEGRELKIGMPSLNALSTGIQQHLKNVLEAAFKTSKSRINRTAFNSYDGISKMIVDHGKGNALPENQHNIAIRWGDDVRAILHAEEVTARKALKYYDSELEESLKEKMSAFDEERSKIVNKRRVNDSDESWWSKEVRERSRKDKTILLFIIHIKIYF